MEDLEIHLVSSASQRRLRIHIRANNRDAKRRKKTIVLIENETHRCDIKTHFTSFAFLALCNLNPRGAVEQSIPVVSSAVAHGRPLAAGGSLYVGTVGTCDIGGKLAALGFVLRHIELNIFALGQ